jgi:uncharacterized protein YggE
MEKRLGLIKSVGIFSIIIVSAFAKAGSALIDGHGEARSMPEYVSLNIAVKSECYNSASEASSANDAIAHQVLLLLKSYANVASGDLITASGGYVQRYNGYNPRTNQPVCVNTFRKENNLTLKTHDLSQFAATFAEIQDRIYAMGKSTSREIEAPTDFIEMGAPAPGVKEATLKILERQALRLALQDAKEKFEVTMELAGVVTYKINRYSESQIVTHDQAEKFSRSHDGISAPAPVEFGHLSVHKILYVEFSFSQDALQIQKH